MHIYIQCKSIESVKINTCNAPSFLAFEMLTVMKAQRIHNNLILLVEYTSAYTTLWNARIIEYGVKLYFFKKYVIIYLTFEFYNLMHCHKRHTTREIIS